LKKHHSEALVLGTGGSSNAVTYVLESLGIGYQLVSRREGEGRITYQALEPDLVNHHKLIINCTPLGMHPGVDACPDLPYQAISRDHLLFDLVYNPAKSLFLTKGEAKGAAVANGYDMLVYQAEASWEIWNRKR
jgi:shikimate dehydrogenase